MNVTRFQRRLLPWVVLAFGLAMASTVRGAVGDHDGDGRSDVFWRNALTGANAIWLSGDASTQRATARLGPRWALVGAGDFDGDGRVDVFWRQRDSGANVIWRSGNAAASQLVQRVADLRWQVAGVGDFNGDGRADVLWRHLGTGAHMVWRSAKAGTQQTVAPVGNLRWVVAGIGDFDGDRRSDVFWRNVRTGANTIWLSANAATRQATTAVTDVRWQVAAIGDFDGDHRADVFWRHLDKGRNAIWRSGHVVTAVARRDNWAWQVAASGDYDGDGRDDLLWRNYLTGANQLWNGGLAIAPQSLAKIEGLDQAVVPYSAQPTAPFVSSADVSLAEGDSGTRPAVFTLKLWHPSVLPVRYALDVLDEDYRTVDADPDSDYVASHIAGQVDPGETSAAVRIDVIGDTTPEANENFTLQWTGADAWNVIDGQWVATIRNDDANTLWIESALVFEGDSGTKQMRFQLHLSRPSRSRVTYSIGTYEIRYTYYRATSDVDFRPVHRFDVVIPAGRTAATLVVPIVGDQLREGEPWDFWPYEEFGVGIIHPVGAVEVDGDATGYIFDDDWPGMHVGLRPSRR